MHIDTHWYTLMHIDNNIMHIGAAQGQASYCFWTVVTVFEFPWRFNEKYVESDLVMFTTFGGFVDIMCVCILESQLGSVNTYMFIYRLLA